jgi:DNA polymerase III alpha subunit
MKEASSHLTLLAMNRKGFDNLIQHSSSTAYLEGFYYKPRIDRETPGRVQRRNHLPVRMCVIRALAPAAGGRQ